MTEAPRWTRRPRPGEVHGREYLFVDEPIFEDMVATGQLLEWAKFAGNSTEPRAARSRSG